MPEPASGDADAGGGTAIPEKVTARWDGELLTVAEAARRLGTEEAEVHSLRHRWELLGLPAGTRERRQYFYTAFQIDAERREIYPQAREANRSQPGRHRFTSSTSKKVMVAPASRPTMAISRPVAAFLLDVAGEAPPGCSQRAGGGYQMPPASIPPALTRVLAFILQFLSGLRLLVAARVDRSGLDAGLDLHGLTSFRYEWWAAHPCRLCR